MATWVRAEIWFFYSLVRQYEDHASMLSVLQSFVDALAVRFDAHQVPRLDILIQVAEDLKTLAHQAELDRRAYPEARPGQELLYQLTEGHPDCPSLYLVSDGPGTSSPPHEHQTWVVIVGLGGTEVNSLYEMDPGIEHGIRKVREHELGSGSSLVLGADQIHSTLVLGNQSTYHLHLYGRKLSSLPSFEARCFPYPSVA